MTPTALPIPKEKFPTLVDWTKSCGPGGKIARIVELLNQTNELLLDMTWLEGNTATGNVSTLRTELPEVIWRKLYKGVPPSKSERRQITDTCGMLETRSEVDRALAELASNLNAF